MTDSIGEQTERRDYTEALKQLDRLRRLSEERDKLLMELERSLLLLQKLQEEFPDLPPGVHAVSAGYRAPTRKEWLGWSVAARCRLPGFMQARRPMACCTSYAGDFVVTHVTTSDGVSRRFRTPLFFPGAPLGRLKTCWENGNVPDSDVPEPFLGEWKEQRALEENRDRP